MFDVVKLPMEAEQQVRKIGLLQELIQKNYKALCSRFEASKYELRHMGCGLDIEGNADNFGIHFRFGDSSTLIFNKLRGYLQYRNDALTMVFEYRYQIKTSKDEPNEVNAIDIKDYNEWAVASIVQKFVNEAVGLALHNDPLIGLRIEPEKKDEDEQRQAS